MSDPASPAAEGAAPVPAPTLVELRRARINLEMEIQGAIAQQLRAFYARTGVAVTAVDVRMQRLWPMEGQQPAPHFAVIGVGATLDV